MYRVDVHRITYLQPHLLRNNFDKRNFKHPFFLGGSGSVGSSMVQFFPGPFWVDPYFLRRSYRNKIWGGWFSDIRGRQMVKFYRIGSHHLEIQSC